MSYFTKKSFTSKRVRLRVRLRRFAIFRDISEQLLSGLTIFKSLKKKTDQKFVSRQEKYLA